MVSCCSSYRCHDRLLNECVPIVGLLTIATYSEPGVYSPSIAVSSTGFTRTDGRRRSSAMWQWTCSTPAHPEYHLSNYWYVIGNHALLYITVILIKIHRTYNNCIPFLSFSHTDALLTFIGYRIFSMVGKNLIASCSSERSLQTRLAAYVSQQARSSLAPFIKLVYSNAVLWTVKWG